MDERYSEGKWTPFYSIAFRRIHFDRVAWLNPVPDDHWDYTSSLCIIRELMDNRMFPLTLKGLEEGMSELSK